MLSNAVCMTLRVRSVSAVRSCTSLNRRSVSIAITAWSAKVDISSIWADVNGRGLFARHRQHADRRALAHQRDAEHGAVFAELLRPGPGVFGSAWISGICTTARSSTVRPLSELRLGVTRWLSMNSVSSRE